MTCEDCGVERQGARFCTGCGRRVVRPVTPGRQRSVLPRPHATVLPGPRTSAESVVDRFRGAPEVVGRRTR